MTYTRGNGKETRGSDYSDFWRTQFLTESRGWIMPVSGSV